MSSEQRTQSRLNIKTLLIAAAASATAAFLIPMIWKPGTVFAAAMTPVIVALVSEMLQRPVETVSAVTVRRTTGGAAILDPPPPPPEEEEKEPFDPLAPPPTEELEALPEAGSAPRAEHRRRRPTAGQWKLALVTGLLAFAAVVAVFTFSELVSGEPVSSGAGRTTFFGGSSSKQSDSDGNESKQQRDEPRDEEKSPTPTPTETPTETPEPKATATPTASPTATPTPLANPAPAAPTPEATP